MSDKTPAQGEFCWNELMTGDPAKAKEFYGSLLDWECQDIDMGDMTYTMLKQGDKDIGGILQIPQGQDVPPHWMSYIMVDNLDEKVGKAKSLGAKIMVDPKAVGDMGRLAVIQDPTGAHISLWESVKKD